MPVFSKETEDVESKVVSDPNCIKHPKRWRHLFGIWQLDPFILG